MIRYVVYTPRWQVRPKHLGLDPAVAEVLANVFGEPLVRCHVRAAYLARVRAQVPVVVVRKERG
jgi:hypothetical protein